MTKKNENEKKRFVFVTCPVCGCETIIETGRRNHRCDCCHQYFLLNYKEGVKWILS